jgi:hypothetical protein
MSRKKKKDKQQQIPLSTPSTLPRSMPMPSVESISTTMKFDAMEDQIRGEEMMMEAEHKKIKEARDVKKALDKSEVDRRLEELRKQLGLPKK